MRLRQRSGTTGTMTVRLWNNTDSVLVTGATCTINVSDLPVCNSTYIEGGWIMFAFAAVTLIAAKSYMVEVITSTSSQVSLYASTGSTDWSRALRTTTAQAPVGGDDWIVSGNWTAAGTLAINTITMDQTANTDYGSNTTSQVTPAGAICQGGILKFKDTSAANPYLKNSGWVIIYNGGILDNAKTDTVTITIASPGVVSLTGHGHTVGERIRLRTTGALPTGLSARTDYYIKTTPDADTFTLSATLGGAAINTTGSQSGTHTQIAGHRRDNLSIMEFDNGSDDSFGLFVKNGGEYNARGLSRTVSKNIYYCLMTADAAASGAAPSTSTLSVDADTGWLSGDVIAVASTTRTDSQCEYGTLNANAGASSIVVKDMTAPAAGSAVPPTSNRGLLYAHHGSSSAQAEVVCLSRNVKYRSASASFMAWLTWTDGAVVDIEWAEFYYTNGFNVDRISTTYAWDFSIRYSVMHTVDTNAAFYLRLLTSSITRAEVHNNIGFNIGGHGVNITASVTDTTWVVSGNIVMRSRGGDGYNLSDVGGTFTNNRAIGGANVGIQIQETDGVLGVFSGNISHSNGSYGLRLQSTNITGDLGAITAWRNNDSGVYFTLNTDGVSLAPTAFGNNGSNLVLQSPNWQHVTVNSPVLNGDTTFSTGSGIRIDSGTGGTSYVTINNGDLSTVSGIKTAHTQDVYVDAGEPKILMHNTKLGAATQIATVSSMTIHGHIRAQKLGQVSGAHKTWTKYGTVATDTVVYNTASPSMVMTPTSASVKLESAIPGYGIQVAVNSGDTVTPSVYVRKTATYNGNQPRLIVRANPSIGISADTVLATYSAGTGSWNVISGTTAAATDDGLMEFIIDCDGTAGAVNVDDFDFGSSGAASMKYWFNGLPELNVPSAQGGVVARANLYQRGTPF